MAGIKETIYSHTPQGRYEQYITRNQALLDQTEGEARYRFEKTLDRDAKRYARRKVAQDVVTVAAVAGGYYVGTKIRKEGLESVAENIGDRIAGLRLAVITAYDEFLKHTGAKAAEGAGAQFEKTAAKVLTKVKRSAPKIGSNMARGAAEELKRQMPDLSAHLQEDIATAAGRAGDELSRSVIRRMPDIIESAGLSLELTALNAFLGPKGGKKGISP